MLGSSKVVYLDGQNLTLPLIQDILENRKRIDLSKQTWRLVERSREAISNMMLDPTKAVYGITTGFGSFANVSISPENRKRLQLNLIRSHSIGVGDPIPLDIVRRMIILRINTLAKGRSGIHPENLRKFICAFNADFLPLIPEQGTVGASGDLAPLSHLALGMLGEGLAWDHDTQKYVPSEQVLAKLGLDKL
jgi:histidine ammonia-lyase